MIYQLKPILTYNLWGGTRLSNTYENQSNQYGEAWVLACLKNQNSFVNNHETLRDLFNKNKDIVQQGYQGEFPILIKLIDAQDDLSIQVHPEVKMEFWHILGEEPSKLYLGFNQEMNREAVEEELQKGNITSTLNYVDASYGDSYLIEPGTVHAIGAHTFLIEIQRNTDITYRLYDFNRTDKNGNKRELHIAQSLDVINYHKLDVVKGPIDNLLVRCPYFTVYKKQIDGDIVLNADPSSFHSIVVISGSGEIVNLNDSTTIPIKQFDSIFVPAGEGNYKISGKLGIILTTL